MWIFKKFLFLKIQISFLPFFLLCLMTSLFVILPPKLFVVVPTEETELFICVLIECFVNIFGTHKLMQHI